MRTACSASPSRCPTAPAFARWQAPAAAARRCGTSSRSAGFVRTWWAGTPRIRPSRSVVPWSRTRWSSGLRRKARGRRSRPAACIRRRSPRRWRSAACIRRRSTRRQSCRSCPMRCASLSARAIASASCSSCWRRRRRCMRWRFGSWSGTTGTSPPSTTRGSIASATSSWSSIHRAWSRWRSVISRRTATAWWASTGSTTCCSMRCCGRPAPTPR